MAAVVGRARSCVRGRSCVVVRGRARSCVRGRPCVVVRGRSCAVVRGRAVVPFCPLRGQHCRAARFASTAVTRTNEQTNERTTSNNPLNPPGVGWVNFFYPIKVRVSMGTQSCGHMRAKFGSDPTAGSKILSFKFISRFQQQSFFFTNFLAKYAMQSWHCLQQ